MIIGILCCWTRPVSRDIGLSIQCVYVKDTCSYISIPYRDIRRLRVCQPIPPTEHQTYPPTWCRRFKVTRHSPLPLLLLQSHWPSSPCLMWPARRGRGTGLWLAREKIFLPSTRVHNSPTRYNAFLSWRQLYHIQSPTDMSVGSSVPCIGFTSATVAIQASQYISFVQSLHLKSDYVYP